MRCIFCSYLFSLFLSMLVVVTIIPTGSWAYPTTQTCTHHVSTTRSWSTELSHPFGFKFFPLQQTKEPHQQQENENQKSTEQEQEQSQECFETPVRSYPVLYPSSSTLPPLFTSWEDLLSIRTRTGKPLSSIPRFMEFVHHHQTLARRWTSNQHKNAKKLMNDYEEKVADSTIDHIPNLLQGGASTGPIMHFPSIGRKIRALAYYPFLNSTCQPVHYVVPQNLHTNTFNNDYPGNGDQFKTHKDVMAWITKLQSPSSHFSTIQNEILSVAPKLQSSSSLSHWTPLRTRKGNEWSTETGWSHIALMDNFQWIPSNMELFPRTMEIVLSVLGKEGRIGPRLIAVAKQSAATGIPSHWDYMNWMWTFHMGLGFVNAKDNSVNALGADMDVEFGENMDNAAGIIINGTDYPWKIGCPLVLDTTFVHSTYNNHPTKDIYMLLIDFWHPDLSLNEIDALRYFWAANSGV